MQKPAQPVLRDIVLVGGGHSHVGVLRNFAMNPIPGVRLTLICRDTHTPYSGMLPGYVAGHYSYDEVHIDLSRLAAFAGARFFRDEALGLDRGNREVLCRNRPPVPYDYLSINIGSTPQVGQVDGASEHAVPVKPINRFNDRWESLLHRMEEHQGPLEIAVVGGGAGGVELALAIQYRLTRELQARNRDASGVSLTLYNASETLLPTHSARVRRKFMAVLAQRGIQVCNRTRITQVEANELVDAQGQQYQADEILWVTQAGGAGWLRETGLDLDRDGFIQVQDSLQTLNDPRVFAAGDIASMINHPREKAGVFAVRQGPPLAENLRRPVLGREHRPYRTQRPGLAIISTRDRYAVASRGPLGFWGSWVWRWKDWIDRRFMARFSEFPPMEEAPEESPAGKVALEGEEAAQALSAVAMRCGGCGAKVGSTVLSRALNQLKPVERDDILIGLHAPDDAAVVRVPEGMAMVHTVDFFRAFIDDPYIFGQIAANHSLGDIFAMGAEAQTATAVATVPYGLEAKTEDLVYQLMSGALSVLNEANCALVGGHTGEGQELALGFAVNGLIDPEKVMRKGGLQEGDCLILTKPLGTGTLFAAYPRLATRGRWIDAALTNMRLSNRLAAQCIHAHGARACTDVTGFGLLGHLVEMTRPSEVDASIDLDALPLLPGAEEMTRAGILSSLQPANVRLRRAIREQAAWVDHPRYPLLFDPQTAGGLLAGVPEDQAQACVDKLRALGYPETTIIGRIHAQGEALEPIRLVAESA